MIHGELRDTKKPTKTFFQFTFAGRRKTQDFAVVARTVLVASLHNHLIHGARRQSLQFVALGVELGRRTVRRYGQLIPHEQASLAEILISGRHFPELELVIDYRRD